MLAILAAVCLFACSTDTPITEESLIRLYPTGNIGPLFECHDEEIAHLASRLRHQPDGTFFRINAGDVSRPGRILSMHQTWSTAVTVQNPDRLTFSAFAVASDVAAINLSIHFRRLESELYTQNLSVPVMDWRDVTWIDYAIDISPIAAGEFDIQFEVEPDQEGIEPTLSSNDDVISGGTGYIFIGSPIVHPQLPESDKPNIALIILDTLRADHLGCGGHPEPVSPVIDALSGKGVLFSSMIACSSWTKPSVNSIMTGQYPHKNKLVGAPFSQFDQEIEIIAERMASNGYQTFGVSSNMLITPISEYDRGFDCFDSRPVNGATLNSTLKMNETICERLPPADQGPFFLFAHYMDPHDHYCPPQPYNSLFTGTVANGVLRDDIRAGDAGKIQGQIDDGTATPLSRDELDYLNAQYMGEIRFDDAMLKNLFNVFMNRYSEKECIVFILSDHGEGFMEHGSLSHGKDLYQESIHVPWLIVSLKSGLKPVIHDQPVSHVDVANTLFGMLGLPFRSNGTDALLNPSESGRSIFSFLSNRRDTNPVWRVALAGDRKYIRMPNDTIESYDLADDPAERNPQPANPSDPLSVSLETIDREEASRRGDYKNPKKVIDQLKSLGYVR